MKTDVIVVTNEERGMEAALNQVDKIAEYKELSGKNALHLRLLAEEMMAMMRSITGKAEGEFWMEDKDGVYELHLKVQKLMDSRQREQLIASSTSGRNEATRGFMGKIRALFDMPSDVPVFQGSFLPGIAPQTQGDLLWSMEDYRLQLQQYRDQNREDAREAWDELEKSVVAHVADDVKVSVRGREAEMTIIKKLA